MSAIGTKQTWAVALHMSAFGGKADMVRRVLANRLKFICGREALGRNAETPGGFLLSLSSGSNARKRPHAIVRTCDNGGVHDERWFWPRTHHELVSGTVRIRRRLA